MGASAAWGMARRTQLSREASHTLCSPPPHLRPREDGNVCWRHRLHCAVRGERPRDRYHRGAGVPHPFYEGEDKGEVRGGMLLCSLVTEAGLPFCLFVRGAPMPHQCDQLRPERCFFSFIGEACAFSPHANTAMTARGQASQEAKVRWRRPVPRSAATASLRRRRRASLVPRHVAHVVGRRQGDP
jgi:hypothetical protein